VAYTTRTQRQDRVPGFRWSGEREGDSLRIRQYRLQNSALPCKDLSHEYLVYLWIEALKEGAKHHNAVIYVPKGADGMPMFRNVESSKKN
jgi:hypothetical protein